MYVKVFLGDNCQNKADRWIDRHKEQVLIEWSNCQVRAHDVVMLTFTIKKGVLIGDVLEIR